VAFQFFTWLVPDRSQPQWVKSAKSRVVLAGTGQWLISMLPEDPETTILKKLKRPRPEDTESPPEQRGAVEQPADSRAEAGYDRSSRAGMRQLLEAKGIAH